jgi:hypothetical protein
LTTGTLCGARRSIRSDSAAASKQSAPALTNANV